MKDFGIVKPGSTVYIEFDSFGASGESITLTGLAVTDIEVYKDGGTTQRGSDNGYTLLDTDGIDFDGLTGIHGLSISLADNTTAGFWAAGSHYRVVVSAVTINSQTVSFTAATFRIGYQGSILDTTIATLASQTSFTLTSGPAEDDALNGREIIIHDVASAVQLGSAVILDYTGSTKTVTLAAGTTFTAAATDNVSVMGFAPLQPTTAGRTLDVSAGGEAGIDWANVGSQGTTVGLSGTTISTSQAVASVGSVTGAVGSVATGGIAAASFAAGAINAAAIADAAIDRATFAADTGLQTIRSNTAQAGSGTTITLDASASAVDNAYKGKRIIITSGTGSIQDSLCTSYVGSTKVATVTGWANGTNPTSGSTFAITNDGAVVVDRMWDVNSGDYTFTAWDSTNGTVYVANQSDIAAEVWLRDPSLNGYVTAQPTWGDVLITSTANELAKVPKSDSNVTWNATAAAQLQSEANDALVANNLDHLFGVAITTGDVANNSFAAKLTSKSATAAYSSYDNTTDALEALRDRGDAAWITATGFSTLDAAGVRSAVGLASANLDTQLDALPTNAELATALGTADDAVLASITSAHSTTDGLIITVAGYIDTEVAAIKAKTDLIPANPASTTNITSASGVILAASGLDSITATAPAGVASNFREMVVQLWRRFFKKTTKSSTQILTYADNGTTVVTTQTISSSGSDQTQGAAS